MTDLPALVERLEAETAKLAALLEEALHELTVNQIELQDKARACDREIRELVGRVDDIERRL